MLPGVRCLLPKVHRNYSRVAAPLTQLTLPFIWFPAANTAFEGWCPCSSESQPGSSVCGGGASNSSVGATLFQRHFTTHKLHPCAFLSQHLFPAERYYDDGNREVLAVVSTLQKWWRWLEGTRELFLIWTGHKNLPHLRSARRFTYHKARWSLFLSHYNYTLSYRPGSRNGKPDTLSLSALLPWHILSWPLAHCA